MTTMETVAQSAGESQPCQWDISVFRGSAVFRMPIAAGSMIVPERRFGNKPNTTTRTLRIMGGTSISGGASFGSFGVLGCTLPRNMPLINITEYINVKILPTMASIGNSTLTSARTLKSASLMANIASKNNSLDKKPLNGGMPAMESDVMSVNVNEIGMMVTRPPSRFKLLVPVSWSTIPMIMNSAPLKVAWLIR